MARVYIAYFGGEQFNFFTPQEAEKGILRAYAGGSIRITFHLPKSLHIKLIEQNGKKMIQLTSNEQQGVVPRYHSYVNEEGLTASTSQGEDNPYLCIPVFPEQPFAHEHPVLDRGLCWVYSNNPGKVCMLFTNAKQGMLADLIEVAEKRANEVVDLALQGKF